MERFLWSILAALALTGTGSAAAGTVADDAGPARAPHVATLRGTLRIVHADNFRNGVSRSHFVLFTKQGRVRVNGGDASMLRLLGRQVEVTGRVSSSGLSLRARSVRAARGSVRRRLAAVSGQQKVLVLLVNFTSDRSQPWTPADVGGVVFTNSNSVASYYSEESSGRISLTGDVRGWFELPYDKSSCAYVTWGSAADSLAQAAGINLSAYTNVQYVFPYTSSCGWSGIANMPGKRSWINGALGTRVMAHELGHNFGTHHASSLSCTSGGVPVSISSS